MCTSVTLTACKDWWDGHADVCYTLPPGLSAGTKLVKGSAPPSKGIERVLRYVLLQKAAA